MDPLKNFYCIKILFLKQWLDHITRTWIHVKTVYWYGSKEAWLGIKYAARILGIVPCVKIKIFKELDHGELCIGNPELYTNEMTEFSNAYVQG